METKEETFLSMAIKYKEEKDNTPWWKFAKRRDLEKSRRSAIDLMIRYGNKF